MTDVPRDARSRIRPGNPAGTRRAQLEAVLDQLAEEHRQLMGICERLRAHRILSGLGPLLDELHTLLIRHFSHEQFPGGLYECLGAYGSHHQAELQVLVREHCTILSSVRALLEHTRAATPERTPELLEGVARILEQLADHERREHALARKLVDASPR